MQCLWRTNINLGCDCDWQIQRTNGLWYSAEYSTFSVTDEVGKYQLTVAGYSGDAGDAMMNTYRGSQYIANRTSDKFLIWLSLSMRQKTGLEERLQNHLFCVEWNLKVWFVVMDSYITSSCTTNPQQIEPVEFEPNLSSAQYVVNGKQFTTLDSDNDGMSGGNCAVYWGSGWWYENCATSSVNRDQSGFWMANGEMHDVQASHVLVKANSAWKPAQHTVYIAATSG